MTTHEAAQNYVESAQHSAVDVKVATTLELPVDDWPQQITDILPPDLITSDTGPPAKKLGHENVAVENVTNPYASPVEQNRYESHSDHGSKSKYSSR